MSPHPKKPKNVVFRFDPADPVYLGRTSTATPLQIVDIQGTKVH